ncbi:MAG: hypothetical protein ACK5LN_00170 [Propioniciclava sp.]
MKLFGNRIPSDVRTRLQDQLGQRPVVLAWARTDDGVAVALPDQLAVDRGGAWECLPWEDVLTGGWDRADGALRWRRVSTSADESVALSDPGSLPEVFRERVEATILVQQTVQAGPGRSITLTGRRSLAEGEVTIRWTAHPAPGVRMEGETLAFVERQLAKLRAEYAF